MTVMEQTAPASDSETGGLTFRQFGTLIGVSRSTVVRLHEDGDLPVLKIRGTYRVPLAFANDLRRTWAQRGRCIVFEDFAAEWMAAHSPAEVTA